MIAAAREEENTASSSSALKNYQVMETSTTKFQRVGSFLALGLLWSLIVTAQNAPDCCRQRTCSCRIYDMLHGSGNHAAGILTLGKRKSGSPEFQTRLYRLMHGPGNHAAGILTMGKRGEFQMDTQVLGSPGGESVCPTSQFGQSQLALPGCATESEAASHRECWEQFLRSCRKEKTTSRGN